MDNTVIKVELEKLCSHPLFSNSAVYTNLLKYLVEKAIEQEDIKEYTIGSDLYGKSYLDGKNDGAVRSNMYKLRKKLAEYYDENSNDHAIFFDVKKGQYNLHFIPKKEFNQRRRKPVIQIPLRTLKFSLAIILGFVLVGISYNNFQSRAPLVWKNYFKKEAKNLVVISDQYVLMEINSFGENHATMYPEINNDADLFKYKDVNTDRMLGKTDFTVMSKMAPYGIKILDEWFLKYKRNFGLQLESKLSYTDIKEHNIVFIGQEKTMNLSKTFFLKDSKVFSVYKDGFKVKKEGQDLIFNTQYETSEKVEFAMVSFSSFSKDKDAFYFVSNNDIGVMATLRNFTDEDWLKEFQQRLPNKASHFNALFKVSGLQRTDIACELVELEILE